MVYDLISFFKIEDDINFLKTEDDHFFGNWIEEKIQRNNATWNL